MSKIFCNSPIFSNQNQSNQCKYIKSNQNIEIGFNAIKNKKLIQSPPVDEFRTNLYFINVNQNLTKKINEKQNIDEKEVLISANTMNGNCFYKN